MVRRAGRACRSSGTARRWPICARCTRSTPTPASGSAGLYVGVNVTGGIAGFYFDPFELYDARHSTNPNVIVIGDDRLGQVGDRQGVPRRSLAVYAGSRFVADPRPQGRVRRRSPPTSACPVVRLQPGGRHRLNPMEPAAAATPTTPSSPARALGRPAGRRGARPAARAVEDAVWAGRSSVAAAPATVHAPRPHRRDPSTRPTSCCGCPAMTPLELAQAVAPVRFALDKLCDRHAARHVRRPHHRRRRLAARPRRRRRPVRRLQQPEALPLVMLAATSWLAGALRATRHGGSIQVIDEAWAAVRHGAAYFQASLKLSRTYGVSTVLVCHRPADLTAQADDGTATAKIAAGLLVRHPDPGPVPPAARTGRRRRRAVRPHRTGTRLARPARPGPGDLADRRPLRGRPDRPHRERAPPVRHRPAMAGRDGGG